MDREQVLQVLRGRATELLELRPDQIVESASFVDDLLVDSLDLVEYTMAIEDDLDVRLPEEDLEGLTNIGQFVDVIMTKFGTPA